MNRRKAGRIIIIVLLIIVVGVHIGIKCWKNRKVEFADENMAKVICGSIYGYGGNVTPENVTWEQLESIDILDIGYSGYYSTIKDLEKCKNLKKLYVNSMLMKNTAAYKIADGKVEKNLSKNDIKNLQKEMSEVLPKLTELKELWVGDLGECKWTSMDFLKGCKQIEDIDIWGSLANDYSVLKECKLLRAVALGKCNISSADDLIGLENLEYITLFNTPLDQNLEEVQKLKDAYPDVDLDIKPSLEERGK